MKTPTHFRTSPLVCCASAVAAALPVWAHAADVSNPPSTGSSVVQMLLGLAAVIIVLFAALHVLKRIGVARGLPSGLMRVIGGIGIGTREKVVIVEVGETWLVLGVAPGQISTLHTLPKQQEHAKTAGSPLANQPDFGGWLKNVIERRSQDVGNKANKGTNGDAS